MNDNTFLTIAVWAVLIALFSVWVIPFIALWLFFEFPELFKIIIWTALIIGIGVLIYVFLQPSIYVALMASISVGFLINHYRKSNE